MSDSISNKTASLAALASHASLARAWQLPTLFAQDKQRFHDFSLEAAGLFLDYSKNHIDATTVSLLTGFARSCGLEQRRDAMFKGEPVNTTEKRPALHTLLRAPADQHFELNGEVLSNDVQQVLKRMDQLSQRIRSGEWLGFTGKVITDVVNIGIGGSDLGPAMACSALRPFIKLGLNVHFLSNVDGHAIDAVLADLSPETTLFIVASKNLQIRFAVGNNRSDHRKVWSIRS